MSNGIALSSSAFFLTSIKGTKKNSASLSIKRLMSQGQAILSIFGRSRVIHFIKMIFIKLLTLCQLRINHLLLTNDSFGFGMVSVSNNNIAMRKIIFSYE